MTFWYHSKNIEKEHDLDTKILKRLPKTELHCHLDGSLSFSMIRTLAGLANISLPESDDDLKKLVVAPENTESLLEYLRTFDFIRPLLQTKEALTLAAYDVARQAALENVIYLEIRFAPELSMDEGLTASETILAVLEGLEKANIEFDMTSRLLICGLRQSSYDTLQSVFEQAIILAEKGVVGFDFAGDEYNYPPEKIKRIIDLASSKGLPLTFHAGECGCPRNISDAISFGVKRIGHVTAIYDQEEILEEFIKNDIVAELCLTSNLQTKAADSISKFPYYALYEKGANITISTDNRTVSDTSLTAEYALYMKHFGTSYEDFLAFNYNAIKGSFISEKDKERLRVELEKKHQSILNED